MKVSLNWVKEFTSVDLPVDKLVEKIGAQLGAVEEVKDIPAKYSGLHVVKVVSCQKHPNADKLHVCLIDDNGYVANIDRDKNGLVQVVCGAPNVEAGMNAVWIPPDSIVPSTVDKDPFRIDAIDIRGTISNGMLASPKELNLGDNYDGILEIEDGVQSGLPFEEMYGLEDYIIDIENKMFTHRPDLFGQLGIARELAGIQGQPFKSPDWYKEDIKLSTDGRNNTHKLAVKNDLPKLVPRFCAVVVKDIKVASSPMWLQVRLTNVGIRPINNIVDITNFIMMETAQPLHAYDYDKLKTGILGIRLSNKGEQVKLIGGKTINLDHESIVITNGSKPIGLGGVMGGAGTEVDANTKNIILEVANFDMNQTRKTAMEHGLFTDAATRFTKNQSPRQTLLVLAKALSDVLRLAGGRQASPVIDDNHFKATDKVVKVTSIFINERLGLSLPATKIKKLLENVEFELKLSGDNLTVTAPFWRTDIEIPEDVVEEVGRLYGYDKLPLALPSRNLEPAAKNLELDFKSDLREIMSRAGGNEVLTYSFVNKKLLELAGQDPKEAYQIRNALSPDLQYYRMSVVPSLLEKVHSNNRLGYEAFVLFEVGKSHLKDLLDEEKLPAEPETLAAVIVDPYVAGAPYFAARNLAGHLFNRLNIYEVTYQPLAEAELYQKTTWLNSFEPSRTAVAWRNQKPLGLVGEPNQKLRTSLKLPKGTSMFELDIAALYDSSQLLSYKPLVRFPSSTQDICLKLETKISYAEADQFMWDALQKQADRHGYNYEIETFDIFQRQDNKSHQQITWRITLSHPERTLTTEKVNIMLDEITKQAKAKLKAERI